MFKTTFCILPLKSFFNVIGRLNGFFLNKNSYFYVQNDGFICKLCNIWLVSVVTVQHQSGGPQGSVLGPLLCLIYTAYHSENVTQFSVHNAVAMINNDLEQIEKY